MRLNKNVKKRLKMKIFILQCWSVGVGGRAQCQALSVSTSSSSSSLWILCGFSPLFPIALFPGFLSTSAHLSPLLMSLTQMHKKRRKIRSKSIFCLFSMLGETGVEKRTKKEKSCGGWALNIHERERDPLYCVYVACAGVTLTYYVIYIIHPSTQSTALEKRRGV
jgi:hypothetical protein